MPIPEPVAAAAAMAAASPGAEEERGTNDVLAHEVGMPRQRSGVGEVIYHQIVKPLDA